MRMRESWSEAYELTVWSLAGYGLWMHVLGWRFGILALLGFSINTLWAVFCRNRKWTNH